MRFLRSELPIGSVFGFVFELQQLSLELPAPLIVQLDFILLELLSLEVVQMFVVLVRLPNPLIHLLLLISGAPPGEFPSAEELSVVVLDHRSFEFWGEVLVGHGDLVVDVANRKGAF